jgi:hypothetical protein
MCKPSCCPGNASRGGGTAVIAVIVILVVVAAARPAAHAALTVAHAAITITLITAATLAGLTVLAAVALVFRRTQRTRLVITSAQPVSDRTRAPAVIPAQADLPVTGRAPLALTSPGQARCQHAIADPEQVAQIITAVLRGLQ